MLDLGECLSLDANNLPPAVYLSSLQTLQLSSEGQEFKSNGALCYNCPVKSQSEEVTGDLLGHFSVNFVRI